MGMVDDDFPLARSHVALLRRLRAEEKARLNAQPCTCVRCGMCNGNCNVRVQGQNMPFDDLDTCPECHGAGITETCGRCMELIEIDNDERDADDQT